MTANFQNVLFNAVISAAQFRGHIIPQIALMEARSVVNLDEESALGVVYQDLLHATVVVDAALSFDEDADDALEIIGRLAFIIGVQVGQNISLMETMKGMPTGHA